VGKEGGDGDLSRSTVTVGVTRAGPGVRFLMYPSFLAKYTPDPAPDDHPWDGNKRAQCLSRRPRNQSIVYTWKYGEGGDESMTIDIKKLFGAWGDLVDS